MIPCMLLSIDIKIVLNFDHILMLYLIVLSMEYGFFGELGISLSLPHIHAADPFEKIK